MTGKLTARSVESFAKRKGRFLDQEGLFLRVLEPGKRVYWVYRYTLDGKEREKSVGAYPAVSLGDARIKLVWTWATPALRASASATRETARSMSPSGHKVSA